MKQATKDKKRLTKLKEILATLKNGGHVQNRKLETWMGDDFDCIANHWKYYQDRKAEFKDKPDEIKQYEAYLKKAMFDYGKAESYRSGKAAKKFYDSAENKFETALEYLQEIISEDQSLREWFDRDTEWGVDNNIGPDPVGMPRVVTSRSLDNLMPSAWPKKIDVKIDCVEKAIDALENPTPKVSKEVIKAKLEQLRNTIKGKR